jgi:hypothetical protein
VRGLRRSYAYRRGVLENLMKLDEPEQHKLKLETEIAMRQRRLPDFIPT